MRKILLLVGITVAGCGPSVDQSFAGTWNGPLTFTWTGYQPNSFSSTLGVTVSASAVRVSMICPDGSGSMVLTGAGDAVDWTGAVSCAPATSGNCSDVVLTFSKGHAERHQDDTFLFAASGAGAGCGASAPFSLSFSGSR